MIFFLNIFLQLERRDVVASQTLRAALTKAEQSHPGLSYDIVMGILKKGDLNVNLNESILRLQGGASETDCKWMASPIQYPSLGFGYCMQRINHFFSSVFRPLKSN